MKCKIVSVMSIVCAAAAIIVGRSRSKHDVFSVELPIYILKAVATRIRVLQYHGAHAPLPQVG